MARWFRLVKDLVLLDIYSQLQLRTARRRRIIQATPRVCNHAAQPFALPQPPLHPTPNPA
jgi:hypothetical protein